MKRFYLAIIVIILGTVNMYSLPFDAAWGMNQDQIKDILKFRSGLIEQKQVRDYSEIYFTFTNNLKATGYELFDKDGELLSQTTVRAYFCFDKNGLLYIDLYLNPGRTISNISELKRIVQKLKEKIKTDDKIDLDVEWIPDEILPDVKGNAIGSNEIIELMTIRTPKEGRFYKSSRIIDGFVIKYSAF
jgi:hypothetical protein